MLNLWKILGSSFKLSFFNTKLHVQLPSGKFYQLNKTAKERVRCASGTTKPRGSSNTNLRPAAEGVVRKRFTSINKHWKMNWDSSPAEVLISFFCFFCSRFTRTRRPDGKEVKWCDCQHQETSYHIHLNQELNCRCCLLSYRHYYYYYYFDDVLGINKLWLLVPISCYGYASYDREAFQLISFSPYLLTRLWTLATI